MVGAVLEELDQAGLRNNTLVLFLSDHGMAFPGIKANCYPDSTRSPWIIRWPGKVAPGSDDRSHMLSCVDLQATMLEAAGLPPAGKSDGRSFLPILNAESQKDRDYVYTSFFHIHGKDAYPMRAVISRDHAYIFNPWSDGKRTFPRMWNGFGAMKERAENDPSMAARIEHLSHRRVEEFYNRKNDPNCLVDLLQGRASTENSPPPVDRYRKELREWLKRVNDSALAAFEERDDPEVLAKFVRDYTARATKAKEELRAYEQEKGYRF